MIHIKWFARGWFLGKEEHSRCLGNWAEGVLVCFGNRDSPPRLPSTIPFIIVMICSPLQTAVGAQATGLNDVGTAWRGVSWR